MNEQSVLGCGRFAESEWTDLITYEGSAPSGPLFEHARECASCRAELNTFASLTAHVGRAAGAEQPKRSAFVGGVLTAVQHERQRHNVHGRKRQPRLGVSPGMRTARPSDAAPWWRMRPAAIVLTAAVTVVAVLGAGVWSWPWSSSRSTGEVLPGGVIVQATNGGPSTVHAAGLSVDAAAAAVAGGGDDVVGRTIRVTLGVQAAVSASRETDANGHSIDAGDRPTEGDQSIGDR